LNEKNTYPDLSGSKANNQDKYILVNCTKNHRSNYFILLFAGLISVSCISHMNEKLTLENLRCEMLVNPEGIDVRNPRLSWGILSQQRNVTQEACHVLVASSPEKLAANEGDLWNSGRIESARSVHIVYNGKPLKSRMKCYWKVKVWSENGESDWSRSAYWSMGLLHYNDWKGRWIGLDRSFPWDSETRFSKLSARYYRKEFETGQKEIRDAIIYISGLGLYELYINGERIGDQVLAPAPTDYTKNVMYNTFDVTKHMRKGRNVTGVVLGNGRYYTMRQNYKPYKIKTFGYPKLLLNLVITYEDGSVETIVTDDSWKMKADGPVRSNNEYDGEEYDARKEMPGWNEQDFDDSGWLQAEYVQEPGGDLQAQMNDNMRIKKIILPVSLTAIQKDKYILDMGQNMAGWLRIKVKGNRGDKVTLRFAESLQENGELFTANLRDARATDVYILKGGEKETWEPSFVYHGFRYVEITGFPGTPSLNDFEGCVIYDDMITTGTFETSSPTINKIFQNAFWSVISNYKGMPTDCPQRDERQPWLGDHAIVSYGESFLLDNCRLYIKWLDDIRYSQKADGCLPDVAPPYYRYYTDNMTWPGTYIVAANMLYNQYGMSRPIKEQYPSMKKWLDYMSERYMVDYILTKDTYGDWCAPPLTTGEGKGKSANVKKPSKLIATAYLYHYLQIMKQFAQLTGHLQDIDHYGSLAEKVKSAFNNKFLNIDSAFYGNNSLTDNLLPLSFGMIPDKSRKQVLQNIADIITVKNNGHLSTGLVGVQWLMRTLTENGMGDIAYRLADNTTYPGWGYMVENGATTIWELWNATTASPDMNSRNHVMLLGDLIVWFFEDLAGIQTNPEKPGFKEIIMNPLFIDGLDHVNASYQSVHGLIRSHWIKEKERLTWRITIPANTSATVYFPSDRKANITESGKEASAAYGVRFVGIREGKAVFRVGSGDYEFEIHK
jgi:alpha-L-rhamnosidase